MRGTRWDLGSRRTRKKRLDPTDGKSCPETGQTSLSRLGLLFFHLFCNGIPYFGTFKVGLWKRTCVRVAMRFFKTHFLSKNRFCFRFLRSVEFCNAYIKASLDLEPF